MKHRLLILLLLLVQQAVMAQPAGGSYFLRNYEGTDYRANPLIWSMIQDPTGLLFLANNDGVLTFDGVRWRLIETPMAVRAIARTPEGQILVGGEGDLGLLQLQPNGSLKYQSISQYLPKGQEVFTEVLRILPVKGGAFFLTDNGGYWMDGTDPMLPKLSPLKLGGMAMAGVSLDGKAYAVISGKGLSELTATGSQVIAGGHTFAQTAVVCMAGHSTSGFVLISDKEEVWSLRNGQAQQIAPELTARLKQSQSYDIAFANERTLAIGTLNGGVILAGLDGSLLGQLNKTTGLPDNNLYSLFVDKEGSLWIGHARGLSQALIQVPVRLMIPGGAGSRITQLVHANGRTYATTIQGVLAGAETLAPVAGISTETWDALPLADGSVLVASNEGVYQVTGTTAKRVSDQSLCYRLMLSAVNPAIVWVGHSKGILKLERQGSTWKSEPAGTETPSEVIALAEDPSGEVVYGTKSHGAFLLRDTPVRIQGLPEKGMVQILGAMGRIVARTKQGYYYIEADKASLDPELTRNAGNNSFLLAMQGNRLCIGTEQGIKLFTRNGSRFAPDTARLTSLISQPVNAAALNNGQVYLATFSQVYAFGAETASLQPAVSALFRAVAVPNQDSLMYGGWQAGAQDGLYLLPVEVGNIRMPDGLRSLEVLFGAPSFLNAEGTQYRTRLDGGDWSAWGKVTAASFASLPSGSYTLEVQARDAFGRLSAITALSFSLPAPWYQSTFAYILYAGVFLMVAFLFAKLYARRVEVEKHKLELLVHERTSEVIQQKKQIEEQVEALHQKNEALDTALTELKETQEQLLQNEKMAALGQLVAGMAHEINTPVGIGVTAASHLDMKTKELKQLITSGQMKRSDFDKYVETASESSQIILKNLDRAAELIQSFKKVAVDQGIQDLREFDLREYLSETLMSISPRIKKTSIEVLLHGPSGIMMFTQPSALSQISINMVVNALVHAFGPEDTGRIDITFAELPDDKVEIRFADNGKGIPQENLAKVFDPFFTTNRGGGGSGLGLHIAFNQATGNLRGMLRVESTLGKGTTFILTVPKILS